MILAAGLGTRLKPWTLSHPKALVPVNGKPMLYWVIQKLKNVGFDEIIINVHHFADQIIKWVDEQKAYLLEGLQVYISDESQELLNTGGGLVKAWRNGLISNDEVVLIHNVDILSNGDVATLVKSMKNTLRANMGEVGETAMSGALLLVSDRDSSRKLIFDDKMTLKGWHNLSDNKFRPAEFIPASEDIELAFSGIYAIRGCALQEMYEMFGMTSFPVMDYFLSEKRNCSISGFNSVDLKLIDIGKPHTLQQADKSFADFVC